MSRKQADCRTVGFLRVGTSSSSGLSGWDEGLLAAGKQMRCDGKWKQEEARDWLGCRRVEVIYPVKAARL
jgi:hypothetical protein